MGAPPGRASQKWLLSTLTTVPTKLVNFKEKMYAFPQDKQNCLLYMGIQLSGCL